VRYLGSNNNNNNSISILYNDNNNNNNNNNNNGWYLYSSPTIIKMIKSRRMRWAGHVARRGVEECI
jgi:hypothetical protein